jgi:hypothetical protein
MKKLKRLILQAPFRIGRGKRAYIFFSISSELPKDKPFAMSAYRCFVLPHLLWIWPTKEEGMPISLNTRQIHCSADMLKQFYKSPNLHLTQHQVCIMPTMFERVINRINFHQHGLLFCVCGGTGP